VPLLLLAKENMSLGDRNTSRDNAAEIMYQQPWVTVSFTGLSLFQRK
jgi:hypothetical protein